MKVAWRSYHEFDSGVTRLELAVRTSLVHYNVGDLVGIKSKCCGHSHNVFEFCGGLTQ